MRALTRGRSRDLLERFSIAAESLAPIALFLMVVPAAAGLGVAGFLAGFWIDRPAGAMLLTAVQYAILAIGVFAAFAPLVFPASTQGAGQMRLLLLLPIPRGLLYATQTVGALADPWIAILVPLLVGVPLGVALSGHALASLVMVAAGALLLLAVLGLAMLSASLLQLLLRNRRRGELAMVIAMLIIPAVSMLPSFFLTEAQERKAGTRAERQADPERSGRNERRDARRFERAVGTVVGALPPGYYVRTASSAATARAGAAAGWVAALGATVAGLHLAGWRVYRRLIETPSTSGGRRARERARQSARRLPGLSAAAAAVAFAFVRLVFRTPRGRTVVFGVVIMMPLLAAMMIRAGGFPMGFATVQPGFGLAIFGVAITLLSLGPMSLNQFAVDRAGLTLQFLAPISDRELLVGKAVGGALAIAGPLVFVLGLSIALSPAASPWLWAALALGTIAVYAILAPANAALSALFPRTVNLASIGRDSNAHQGANLLGLIALVASAAPPAAAAAAGLLLFRSEAIAAALVGLWMLAALAIASLALRLVERLLAARRENLALVAQGR